MNKCILIGRLTKDPELRFSAGTGKAITRFNIAINRIAHKEEEQQADFISIVSFGKQAESIANYLVKGSKIAVDGTLRTRSYEDKNNNKRYVTEVIASKVEFLDNKGSNNTNKENNNQNNFNGLDSDLEPADYDEIPF